MKVLQTAYIDETGVLTTSIQEQPVFGIGLLVVKDPAEVTGSFYKLHFDFLSRKLAERRQIRRGILGKGGQPTLAEVDALMRDSWHREYKFTRIARHNLPQYIELLNLYFSFNSLEFHALLLDRTDPDFRLARWGSNPWEAYVALGREQLRGCLTEPTFAIVDFQAQPRKSSVSVEREFCSVPEVAGCIRASSESEVFLQVVDVLLGCVQAEWRESNGLYPENSSRAGARKSLVGYMKTRLGIPADETMVTRQRPFWATSVPSPFTVSLHR